MAKIHSTAIVEDGAVLGADVSLDWLTSKLAETDSAYNVQSPRAVQLMGLKSQSYIINYDGKFITHPEAEKRFGQRGIRIAGTLHRLLRGGGIPSGLLPEAPG